MESIFLILSGVIVLAGVLYWFWSHLQLTQKKVQLLESAVFELRGMMSSSSPPPGPPVLSGSVAVPEEKIVYTDLEDDEADWEPEKTESTSPISAVDSADVRIEREDYSEDLQPGGRLLVPTEEELAEQEEKPEEFRELFVQKDVAPSPASGESLDSMPLKELRRLGEKRGISGANEMRKKELLAALRKGVSAPVQSVTIEKALEIDLQLETAEETTEAEILE